MPKDIQYLGEPIIGNTFLDERFALVDGKQLLYTTASGCPCVLNVYNITDDRLEAAFPMPGSLHCWSHGIDGAGNLYIAPMDQARLFRYCPADGSFADLGDILGQVAAYQLNFDEAGRVYAGTYPSGSVVRYDPARKAFRDYGPVVPGHHYVKSLAYDRGTLYAGTAARGAKIVKLDAATGQKELLALPADMNPELFDNFYAMTIVNRLLFLYTYYNNDKLLLVYHLDDGCWLDVRIPRFGGLYVSPALEGKSYFCADSRFRSFDHSTYEVAETGIPAPANGKGFGVFPDPHTGRDRLYCIDHSGSLNLLAVDFARGVTEARPLLGRLRGGALLPTAMEAGPGRSLYLGAYMGGAGCAYQVDTGEQKAFRVDQTEGMVSAGDVLYYGVYPGGRIYRHRPGEACELLRSIGEEQDRPFAMVWQDDALYIGTVPDYNRLGGALTIYRPSTEAWRVWRNIVPGHSVSGLAVADGLVYGGTDIHGGLGIAPADQAARVFAWDPAAEGLVRSVTPDIPGLGEPVERIGRMVADRGGLLWCVGRSAGRAAIFALDRATLQTVKQLVLEPQNLSPSWRPAVLRWGPDGRLYAAIGGLVALDTATMEWERLAEEASLLAFGADGHLYYTKGPGLYKIAL